MSLLFQKGNFSIPNLITYLRFVLLPLIIYFAELETIGPPSLNQSTFIETYGKWASLMLLISGFSAFFDGYFARKYNIETKLGTLLDPLADKLTSLISFTVLLKLQRIDIYSFLILISRELVVTSLRSFEGIKISSSMIGKTKATFQFLGAGFLLYWHPFFFIDCQFFGNLFIYISVILSLIFCFLLILSIQ